MRVRKYLFYDENTKKYSFQYVFKDPVTKEKTKFHGICYKLDEKDQDIVTDEPCSGIKEAQAFLDKHRQDALNGKFRKVKNTVNTLAELVNLYYEEVVSVEHAQPNYMYTIMKRFCAIVCEINQDEFYPAVKVSKADIIRYRNKRKKMPIQVRTKDGWKDTNDYPMNSSINREVVLIEGMFTYAIDTLKMKFEEHPCRNLVPLKEDNIDYAVVTKSHKATIYEKALSSSQLIHLFAIIFTLDSTGTRRNEILGLEWNNVHFEPIYFDFGHLKLLNTKNGKSRIVPMTADLNYLLYQMKKYATSKYVFVNRRTNTRYGQITNGVKTLLTTIGLYKKGLGCHVFRHGFATDLDELGVSLSVIQELLGHSKIGQTKDYIVVDKNRKFEAVNLRGDCDISESKKIIAMKRKREKKIDYRKYIDIYMEYVKNSHRIPISIFSKNKDQHFAGLYGAGDEARTRDILLGKEAFYH